MQLGSPPLMREGHSYHEKRKRIAGITPAYAGRTILVIVALHLS